MKILVTGAAGYIGSVVVEKLVEEGCQVFALDNLQNGHAEAVHPAASFIKKDLLHHDWLLDFFSQNHFDAVFHLAAEALIDESVRDPGRFFRANICAGINLVQGMVRSGCRKLVFSSTAAVYGQPEHVPISESDPLSPVNPYGESKLAFERLLPWYAAAHNLEYVSLRYFNACGATDQCGEDRDKETHLIPVAIAAALGKRDALQLFGTDYSTSDGTCIRDYVHVADIASAHILALREMETASGRAYNLGNGNGFSNLEVIRAVKNVTGIDFDVIPNPRRPGDPERLVASWQAILNDLSWRPAYTDLHAMVESSWKWRLAHPNGYRP